MPSPHERTEHNESGKGFKAKLGTSRLVSYEDLLIAQYIDEIKKPPDVSQKTRSSPYLGRYQSLEEGLSKQGLSAPSSAKGDRPISASHERRNARRSQSQRPYSAAHTYQKPKIDAKFIADHSLWDPATPREETTPASRRRNNTRPQSAPNRPASGKQTYAEMIDYEVYQSKRPKKKKPLYKRQPYVIRCVVYKNGDRDTSAQVAAPNVKQLLEACTTKLNLNGAARRIFLDDGTEIFETDEIPRDGEVYVSNGEAFKDPFKSLIERHEQKQQLQWTLTGITLPTKDGKKKSKKFLLSNRFKKLITVTNRRVMVYLNGQHTNCHEVITDLKSFPDFLGDVTSKLALRRHARHLYDWTGCEIKSFDQIPILDACLQEVGTPVLGPVWVSTGEGFSPAGACKFLDELIHHLNRLLQDAKFRGKQLEQARNEQEDNSDLDVQSSLRKDISTLSDEINNLKVVKTKMKELHQTVTDMAQQEQDAGVSYTLKHIKELDMSDSAVGGSGLKLKVYVNGDYGVPSLVYFNKRQQSRGISDDKIILARLLEQCGSRVLPSNHGTKMARRMFDVNGNEIKSLSSLSSEQEVFVSMGEPFKSPFVLCLQANFEQVQGVDMRLPSDQPPRKTVILQQTINFQEFNCRDFEGVMRFPDDYKWIECSEETKPEVRETIMECKELDLNNSWLTHKDKQDLVLYPSLVFAEKKGREDVLWPEEAQRWVLTKEGYITCMSPSYLVVSVLDLPVKCHLRTKSASEVDGSAVGLQKRQKGNLSQQWRFTSHGTIYSLAQPGSFLTFLGLRQGKSDDDSIKNEADGAPSGFVPHLAVCPKIAGKDSSYQRFAMKQERFENLGQWKHNDHEVVTNPEFNKLAYSWPINAKDEWNDKFDWPMEFSLIAQAPTVQKAKTEQFGHIPLRLIVMKNGEPETTKGYPVVGPNLTNMMKDMGKTNDKKSTTHRHSNHNHNSHHSQHNTERSQSAKGDRKQKPEQDDSISDFPLHCDDLTFRELEFRLFLERCTSALNLPFAARRLFDETGVEHFSLKELQRDQLVYVTCGEVWIDSRISKAESQRRFLLTNLVSDIAQIRQFCALRDTEGYVMEVEGAAVPNAAIIINHCPEMSEKIESEIEEQEKERANDQAQIEEDLLNAATTAHERSHQKLDDQGDKLKWPWERLANEEFTGMQESPRRSPSPLRHKSGRKMARNIQKFVYDDGYISCHLEPGLVLGAVSDGEGQNVGITLVKRKADDLSQMWILQPNGQIFARSIMSRLHRDMVLTVSMPTNQRKDEDGLMLNYVGSQVVLQKRKSVQFGCASQRWHVDKESCFIYAFHTNHLDVEITAANKANVCTYSVTKEELDQPGYIVSLPSKSSQVKEIIVCTSCARAMRGRFKLTKIPERTDFSCAMGTTNHKELRNIGSFHCLNGKVDLSTFEAINTLDEWETKYNSLREKTSVRAIAKEISAAEQPPSVRIYAYRNGDGRQKEGQLIVGSSVIGLLDQCTYRLGMNSAARKLYARDGTPLLDIDDVTAWAIDHYTANMQKKAHRENGLDEGEQSSPLEHADENQSEDSVEVLQYQTFTVKTDGTGDSYQPVNSDPIDLEHALLEVTSGCNNHIALVSTSGTESEVVYEIILGRTSDSAIIIHPSPSDQANEMTDKEFQDMKVSRFPAIEASGGSSERFWFSWSGGEVRVGQGFKQGENVFMSSDDSSVRKISSIVVASPGADTTWKFNLPVIGSTVSSNASGPTDLHKLMDKVQLDEDEEDTGSKKEDLSTSSAHTYKIPRPKTAAPPNKLKLPPVDTIMRYPIEVWASSGESFTPPDRVAADQKEMRHYRKLVSDISFELQKEKHKLRQLQGRRLMEQHPGHYESTGSAVTPVIKKNHWQQLSYNESVIHNEVHQLENQQAALKAKQRAQIFRPRPGSRLYQPSKMKRVMAFANGESVSRSQYVWGDNLDQILQNATSRLAMRRPAKHIYSLAGEPITFDSLEKDQIICISSGGPFQRPRDIQQDIEIRANWTRARKQHGPEATDITVTAQLNPDIDVDPFGPPSLASQSKRSR